MIPTPTGASPKKRPPFADTPMMRQYFQHKEAHPDALLFFRMGDFYEMFFDDAVAAAPILDIALTRRGKSQGRERAKSQDEEQIPMCGVPVHALDGYVEKLIRAGRQVAICEQMEDPTEARRLRGAKAVVRREVVRLVTSGTLTEESLLDARANNYVAALAEAQNRIAFAWLEVSTGEFRVQPAGIDDLATVVARVAPRELLLPERMFERESLRAALGEWEEILAPLSDARFGSDNARRRLEDLYGVASLDAFGNFAREECAAAGALVDYVALTQAGKLPRLGPLRQTTANAVMEIDAATRRNLELTRSLAGARDGSLLAAVDRTITGAGARLLASRLAAPLTDVAEINARLDMIGHFITGPAQRDALRDLLRGLPDLERPISRLSLERGKPRDLGAVRDGLARCAPLRALFASEEPGLPRLLAEALANLAGHEALSERLSSNLGDPLPTYVREGGVIAEGCSQELDEQRELRDEGRRLIAALESRYREQTGIASLKVRHNNVLGYFVEVTSRNASSLDETFQHRQTMANAMRYSTSELADLADKIAAAGDRVLALERALFDELVGAVTAAGDRIGATAVAIARLDLAAAFAALAEERRWRRPELDESIGFDVRQGRHPVVEAALGDGETFVPNDCDMEQGGNLWLVTGPNMAGKSTFLRQNALIAVLAQTGSFVPANSARIGVIDRLFSRVGAADDLARGRSTFMVEMVETAAILHQATPRSLVILDEIGRGTATHDGLSIAWATLEYLHDVNQCRALFATHYHELVDLTGRLARCEAYSMRVKEWQGEVVFLHEITPGAADRSYGIHVAKLAGLPAPVVARATTVLDGLNRGETSSAATQLAENLPLFNVAGGRDAGGREESRKSALEATLAEINPDALAPREALETLYTLKNLLASGKGEKQD